MLGPFRIIGLLGVGGMATVYQAYDSSLERDVALKVLPPEYLHDESFARRFRQEARVVARLEHPNIVPIYASGIDQGTPWMSMRLLGGGSLGALLSRARPGLEQTVQTLRGVADALDYAHARGIIHRDIKPTNILLDRADHVCVADFGLAYMMDFGLSMTRTGTVAGTPQYMAPEQGLGKTVDHRSDIYSLGIVAFEMLTGAVPFTADSPVAVLLKHVNEPLPVVAPETAPGAVIRAVRKALEKDPESRWSSAGEFVHALEQGLTGADSDVGVAGDRRGRLAWVAGTLALAALIVAAFSYELVRPRGSTTTSSAVAAEPATAGPVPPQDPPVVDPPVVVEKPVAPPSASVLQRPPAQRPAALPISRGVGGASTPPDDSSVRVGPSEPVTVSPPVDPPTSPVAAGTTGVVIAPGLAGPAAVSGPVERTEPSKPDALPRRVDVLTPPVRIRDVLPIYPPASRAALIAGNVVLQVAVAVDGTVTDATVVRTAHQSLNEAARRAVRQYRYKPALRNGVPEPSTVETTVSFRLE
jgi:serine/threonine-protein kinase